MNPTVAAAAALQAPAAPQAPHPGLPPHGGPTSTCTICGCDLSGHRLFHIRYRVCPDHATADVVLNKGVPSRFCQQCGRFHPLEAFEPSLRSCRQQLARHAARRRERRRQAAAAKAATHGEAEPAAAAPQQQASVQQKRRRQPQIQPQRQEQQAQQTQLPQQLQQQAAAAAAAALPSTQDAGLVAQLPAAEPASKRRRTGSEGSTLSSHEAGVAGALGTVLGSGGSSGIFPPVPAAVAPKVPLLTAVPANWAAAAPAPTLSPAWMLQAAGLPLAAPQPAAPAAPVAAPAAAQALRPDSARAAEAAQLLAALMREPALASLLSPLQQRTPRQVSDPAALPSEAADGAALGEDGLASGPHPPSAWEAASRPLCRHAAPPAPQLEVSPPPPLPGTQHAFTAPQPPSAVLPPPCLPLLQAPSAGVAPPAPALGAVAAGLQRAATLELICRVQLAQRDYDVECLLLRLAAMSPTDCEAQLVQLLAGMAGASPSM